jgi:hypothetical protein
MTLQEYMREMMLMKKQNFTEYDMYSVIASLMRDGRNIQELSLRDVNRRWGRTNKGRVFYGLSGVPDFAILDSEFINSENWLDDIDMVYGCVEIKIIDNTLLSIKEIIKKINNRDEITKEEGQLLGEVLWYKKVLYTNGLVWKFLKWTEYQSAWENIKDLVKERIEKENEPVTKEEIPSEWYQSEKINLKGIVINEEEYINLSADTTDEQWNKFVEKIYKIEWHS